MKILILISLFSIQSFALSTSERKKCIKSFKKWEKKQSEKELKKLQDSKCLESEEFKLEFERVQLKSSSGKYLNSKFQFKEKDLKKIIDSHFDKLKNQFGSFDKLRGSKKVDYQKTLSSCFLNLVNVEKVNAAESLKENEWIINFQVSDAQINGLSLVKFKDEVSYNKNIKDSHFSRAMDKAKKEVGKVFLNCILRPAKFFK